MFFAAFNPDSEFKEASEQPMELPEEDPATFERLLSWLYRGQYGLADCEHPKDTQERYLQLAKLYVLTDKYNVPKLKRGVVDQFFDLRSTARNLPPMSDVILYTYATTMKGSALRRLLVDWYLWEIEMRWYHFPCLSRVPEFGNELAAASKNAPPARGKKRLRSSDLYEQDADIKSDDAQAGSEAGDRCK